MAGGRDTMDMIKYLLKEQLSTDLQANLDISMALTKYLSRPDTTDSVFEKLLDMMSVPTVSDSAVLNRGLKFVNTHAPVNPPSLSLCDRLERFFDSQKLKCKADLFGVMKTIFQSLRNRKSGDYQSAVKSIVLPSTPPPQQTRSASNSAGFFPGLMIQSNTLSPSTTHNATLTRLVHDFSVLKPPPKWFPPGKQSSLLDSGLFGWLFKRNPVESQGHPFLPSLSMKEALVISDQVHLSTATNIVRAAKKSENSQTHRDIEVTLKKKTPGLFQYKHYKEQQPLNLEPVEIHRVISAVVSPPDDDPAIRSFASTIVIKLFMDMYRVDDKTGCDNILMLLFEMIDSSQVETRVHAFNMIFNLSIHANLLEDNQSVKIIHTRDGQKLKIAANSQAIHELQMDLFQKLRNMLLWLYTSEEEDERVWSAAMKCLMFFAVKEGQVAMYLLRRVDLRIMAAFLKNLRTQGDETEKQIVRLMLNHCYKIDRFDVVSFLNAFDAPNVVQLYMKTRSREVRNNMFFVIFESIVDNLVRKKQIQSNSEQIGLIFELLKRFDVPQLLQNVFKFCKEKVFVENFVKFVFLDRLKNDPTMSEITPKLDRSFIITVLYDIVKMTQTYWQLEKEFESSYIHTTTTDEYKESEFNTLRSLLCSMSESDRRQGESWLFSLLKCDPERGKSCRQHADALYSKLAYHANPVVRRSYITVTERFVLYIKIMVGEASNEEHYVLIFRSLNESMYRLIDAQEKNEQNLLEMSDIIVNMIGVHSLRQADDPYSDVPADTPYEMILQGHFAIMSYLLYRVDMRILLHIYNNLQSTVYHTPKAAILFLITEICKNKLNATNVANIPNISFFTEQLQVQDTRIALISSNYIVEHFRKEQPEKYKQVITKARESKDELLLNSTYRQAKLFVGAH